MVITGSSINHSDLTFSVEQPKDSFLGLFDNESEGIFFLLFPYNGMFQKAWVFRNTEARISNLLEEFNLLIKSEKILFITHGDISSPPGSWN